MSGEAHRPSRPGADRLVFIGDVHLDRDDPDLPAFLDFLRDLGETSRRIVFLGDLFNLWLGRRELEQPHQTAVVQVLEELRAKGVAIRYLEGNRDFHLARIYAGRAVDEAGDRGVTEEWGGRRFFVAHGDLANVRDRQYRLWRGISRSRLAWGLFNLLPAGSRLRLADSLERRFRSTNLSYKRRFPEAEVREYASRQLARGHDAVVLGHFHVEREIVLAPPGPEGRILVLPEWKGSRRHLEVDEDGRAVFVDSGY